MDQSFSLTGRRILITGAASGMGRSFAELAAADGAHVGLLDLNAAGLDETVGIARPAPAPARPSRSTSATGPPPRRPWPSCATALGGFDAICNIAGWDAPGRFWEQPYEMWQRADRRQPLVVPARLPRDASPTWSRRSRARS